MDAKSNYKKYNHMVDTDFDIEINMYKASRSRLIAELRRIKAIKTDSSSAEDLKDWMCTLLVKHINQKTLLIAFKNNGIIPKDLEKL